jgi:hypothetical protein
VALLQHLHAAHPRRRRGERGNPSRSAWRERGRACAVAWWRIGWDAAKAKRSEATRTVVYWASLHVSAQTEDCVTSHRSLLASTLDRSREAAEAAAGCGAAGCTTTTAAAAAAADAFAIAACSAASICSVPPRSAM